MRAAFAGAFATAKVSDEEAIIQQLDRRIAAREPQAWARLASQIETDTLDAFAGAIAERLPAPPERDRAVLIAKVMLAVITHHFAAADAASAMRDTAGQIDTPSAIARRVDDLTHCAICVSITQ